jgi:hypothetical protein
MHFRAVDLLYSLRQNRPSLCDISLWIFDRLGRVIVLQHVLDAPIWDQPDQRGGNEDPLRDPCKT